MQRRSGDKAHFAESSLLAWHCANKPPASHPSALVTITTCLLMFTNITWSADRTSVMVKQMFHQQRRPFKPGPLIWTQLASAFPADPSDCCRGDVALRAAGQEASRQVFIITNSNHADPKKEVNKQSLEPRRGFYLQWIIGEGASRLQPIRHSLAGYADADSAAPANLSK